MIKIAPSILAADQLNLGRDVQRMIDAGCDMLHVDVMDAHFVPNLSFCPATVLALHERFPALPLDVHLMMDNPEKYIERFARSGAWGITIHAEIGDKVGECLELIRSFGVSVGLSVKPDTSIDSIAHLLPRIDLLLVMTVEPGFGGQQFRYDLLDKLNQARALGFTGMLETDGGVTILNLPEQAARGLDMAVMGTAMFRSKDPAADAEKIHAM